MIILNSGSLLKSVVDLHSRTERRKLSRIPQFCHAEKRRYLSFVKKMERVPLWIKHATLWMECYIYKINHESGNCTKIKIMILTSTFKVNVISSNSPIQIYRLPCPIYNSPIQIYRLACPIYNSPIQIYRLPCPIYNSPNPNL